MKICQVYLNVPQNLSSPIPSGIVVALNKGITVEYARKTAERAAKAARTKTNSTVNSVLNAVRKVLETMGYVTSCETIKVETEKFK